MKEDEFKRVEGKYIEVNGLKMYFEEYGEGYPLILIHGGISSIQMWNNQIPSFSKHFKVIAVDCRGQGKTNNPTGEFRYKFMADDFAQLIKELKLEKVLICGWSDGGQIGLEMGLHYPELIRAMVLGGTMIHCTQEMIDGFREIGINNPNDVDYEKLDKSFPWLVKLLKQETKSQGEEYWKKLLLDITKMWFDPAEFPGEKIKAIKTPSLILLGDRDDYVPISEATQMYELMENSELAIIPNGNHGVYFSKPKQFNIIVIDYLKKQLEDK